MSSMGYANALRRGAPSQKQTQQQSPRTEKASNDDSVRKSAPNPKNNNADDPQRNNNSQMNENAWTKIRSAASGGPSKNSKWEQVGRPERHDAISKHHKQPAPPKANNKSKKPKPHERTLNLGDHLAKDSTATSAKVRTKPFKNTSVQARSTAPSGPKTRPPATATAASSLQLADKDFPALAASPTVTPRSVMTSPQQYSKITPRASQSSSKKALPRSQQQKSNSAKKQKLMGPSLQTKRQATKKHESMESRIANPFKKKHGMKQQETKDAMAQMNSLGKEHDLLRLVGNNGGKLKKVQKGRQRIRPRKKNFSTLKKKVLQERLAQWKQAHPQQEEETAEVSRSCVVCLRGYATPDELEDEDEYQEIMTNLNSMATKIGGPVLDIFFRDGQNNSEEGQEDNCSAFVVYEKSVDAEAARACWDGLFIGGQRLGVDLVPFSVDVTQQSNDNARDEWRRAIMAISLKSLQPSTTSNTDQNTSDERRHQVSTMIVLENILTEEDFQDEDELKESLADIRTMAEACGSIADIQTRQSDGAVLVAFDTNAGANQALEKFSGMVIGGKIVSTRLCNAGGSQPKLQQMGPTILALENILTQDDFEDEDSLEESLTDIRSLAQEIGFVIDVQAGKEAGGMVLVTFEGQDDAKRAVERFSGAVIGGQVVSACLYDTEKQEKLSAHDSSSWIVLKNVLTEDDLEDDDSLEEARSDIIELAGHYGDVLNVEVDVQDGGMIRIQYGGDYSVASLAVCKFDGMVIGGQTICATLLSEEKNNAKLTVSSAQAGNRAEEPKPMFSGDKLIPERFAECKRVPKIPNPVAGPRHYATLVENESVKPLLVDMLGELMRLQNRAMEEKNAKARRRLVMGLREVARGIRAHKVKMVVMANNLDQYGVIDDKLQGILDLARQEDVPVFFEFSKRTLGKAVRKSIKVAVVGIQNAEGAHQQFKKLVSLAPVPL